MGVTNMDETLKDNLKNLQILLKKHDGRQLITNDEFTSGLTDIINAFAQYRSATASINKDTQDTLNLIVKRVNEEHDRILTEVKESKLESKSDVTEAIKKAVDKCRKIQDEMKAMDFQDGKDGADGRDGTDGKDGKDGSPDTGDEIKNKLEALKGDTRLDKTAIKGLEKILTGEDLDRAISILDQRSQYLINKTVKHDATLSGSGTDADPLKVVSSGSTTFYTETPSGTTDGVNKTYTVSHGITSIVTFAINGQFIHPQDYIATGTTITFNNALDSSYSGLNFTIVYV